MVEIESIIREEGTYLKDQDEGDHHTHLELMLITINSSTNPGRGWGSIVEKVGTSIAWPPKPHFICIQPWLWWMTPHTITHQDKCIKLWVDAPNFVATYFMQLSSPVCSLPNPELEDTLSVLDPEPDPLTDPAPGQKMVRGGEYLYFLSMCVIPAR